jgi:hypothetical protein
MRGRGNREGGRKGREGKADLDGTFSEGVEHIEGGYVLLSCNYDNWEKNN